MILVLLVAMTAVAIAGSFYLYSVYRRSRPVYLSLKNGSRGWRGKVHAASAVYGFSPVPGSTGAHTFPEGPDLPMRYDEDGCRIPVNYTGREPGRPLLLTLGCSFTYGDAVPAEDTFTWQAGEILGWNTINAGVCSYGLVEMLFRARELIPRYKPDVVIIQWSKWLCRRAQFPFAPIYYGLLPTPYFFSGQEGLDIHPPVFLPILFDLPFDEYRNRNKSTWDFISFFFRVTLPLYIHDDLHFHLYNLKKFFGVIPEPEGDSVRIVHAVYNEIGRLTRENNGRAYVLYLPWKHNFKPLWPVFKELDLPVIDSQLLLLEELPEGDRKQTFKLQYWHWRGEPAYWVDQHPNEKAHRLIAEAIAARIKIDTAETTGGAPDIAEGK